MKLMINGKEVELHFGVRFVRELDKVAGVQQGNISLGMSLTKTLPALLAFDPVALSTVIYAAAYETKPRLKMADIDDFIDNDADLEDHYNEIVKSVQESTATKLVLKNLQA
ncbi:tail assembly chaperone [Ligilactobacillus saerimneri]|uniref:Phage protein n=1 Tax=Ligilactobacillus saerimneri 30a TaxID=1227363 RepID=M5J6G4_9LACO|nr:tail assembly chaperone [Ligilactobacillus saerimneri]EKW99380.1 hypothetical protein D271_02334 [Ligilactobacillus saerimneri 30a]